MAKKRRIGPEDSEVRAQLVSAAAELLATEGYINFSARKVGAKAGLTPQLLYYYFKTMDDLLLAVIRDFNERRFAQLHEAVSSTDPLRAMWELTYSNLPKAKLAVELTTIASHNDTIRDEIVESAERFRHLQIKAISNAIPKKKANEDNVSATEVLMVAFSLARLIVTEASLGFTTGHQESLNFIERMLARYQPDTSDNSR